jgi:hypothetical protein
VEDIVVQEQFNEKYRAKHDSEGRPIADLVGAGTTMESLTRSTSCFSAARSLIEPVEDRFGDQEGEIDK